MIWAGVVAVAEVPPVRALPGSALAAPSWFPPQEERETPRKDRIKAVEYTACSTISLLCFLIHER